MGFITPSDGWDDNTAPLQLQKSQTGHNVGQPAQNAYLAERQLSRRYLQCKICDQGALIAKKVFRMSGPAVVIGFILLVPSVLGIVFSTLMFFGVAYAANKVGTADRERAASRMRQAYVPEPIIEAVLDENRAKVDEWANDTNTAYMAVRAVREEQSGLSAGTAGAGLGTAIGGGMALFLGICSFVGGLFGWLLVMRKRVLQCGLCGAVVNAS